MRASPSAWLSLRRLTGHRSVTILTCINAVFRRTWRAGDNIMRAWVCIVVIGLAAGCSRGPTTAKWDSFFTEWLQKHGETNVVADAHGVGVANNATRLKASLYGSKRQKDGGYIVETEFRVRLPSNGEIVEYLAGTGETEDQAVNDCLVNFTLTTFHVVYKGFINPSDPHQNVEPLPINGASRELIMGDILMRGGESVQNLDLSAMRPHFRKAIAGLSLSPQVHWIKIVYGQHNGAPVEVSATLDNREHPALTSAIKGLNWPKCDGFYLAKQFVVIK